MNDEVDLEAKLSFVIKFLFYFPQKLTDKRLEIGFEHYNLFFLWYHLEILSWKGYTFSCNSFVI